MRILLAQINPTVGDIAGNCKKILQAITIGKAKSADLVVLPELALSGYPPDDFLLLPDFIQTIDHHLEKIVEATNGIAAIVGTPKSNPRAREKRLCNSAAILNNGSIIGFQDKTLLPTYDVFDERRYFEPALKTFSWNIRGQKIGVTICEDIWQHTEMVKDTAYLHDPVKDLLFQKPEILINLSASPFKRKKCLERVEVCRGVSKALRCPVLLCNQVGGNDSLIFDGYSLSTDVNGSLVHLAKGFEEDFLLIDTEHSRTPISLRIDDTEDLFDALCLGLRDYFSKLDFKKACLGISGGIDSAVSACLAVKALGKENVLGLTMPSRYSSEEGKTDAKQLMDALGIAHKVIPIESPFQTFLQLLHPHFLGLPFDTTEENLQARIRGMILMAFSNKFGYIVLSTGNKSEMAMGYSTLYGDLCGGLGVISDVSKMQVYELARWINRNGEVIPEGIIQRPPSAELKEGQRDQDSLPDYAIVDRVLEAYVEKHLPPQQIAEKFNYPFEVVNDLIKRIHDNEYKRRQSPPGLRVTSRAFSVGRRFPIVQKWQQ